MLKFCLFRNANSVGFNDSDRTFATHFLNQICLSVNLKVDVVSVVPELGVKHDDDGAVGIAVGRSDDVAVRAGVESRGGGGDEGWGVSYSPQIHVGAEVAVVSESQ